MTVVLILEPEDWESSGAETGVHYWVMIVAPSVFELLLSDIVVILAR